MAFLFYILLITRLLVSRTPRAGSLPRAENVPEATESAGLKPPESLPQAPKNGAEDLSIDVKITLKGISKKITQKASRHK
jgi:hypothetical protein